MASRTLEPLKCIFLLALAVVSDYVPRALQVPARVGVLGLTGVMFAGLLKVSLTGPGIGGESGGSNYNSQDSPCALHVSNTRILLHAGAIKELWKRESKA